MIKLLAKMLILSFVVSSCVTKKMPEVRKVTVEEWSEGYPIEPPKAETASKEVKTDEMKKFNLISLGLTGFASHPKDNKPYYTVDKNGNIAQTAILDGKNKVHHYSMKSFKPVILNVSPSTDENFKNIEDYETKRSWAIGSFLYLPAIVSVLNPPIAAYFGVLSFSTYLTSYFSKKTVNEYVVIREKYTDKLNKRIFSKNETDSPKQIKK